MAIGIDSFRKIGEGAFHSDLGKVEVKSLRKMNTFDLKLLRLLRPNIIKIKLRSVFSVKYWPNTECLMAFAEK